MQVDEEPVFTNEPEMESPTNSMDQGKVPKVKNRLKCKYCNEEFLRSRGWRIRWKNHNEFCPSKPKAAAIHGKTAFFGKEDDKQTSEQSENNKVQGIKCEIKGCDFYYKDNSSQPRNQYRRHLMLQHFM